MRIISTVTTDLTYDQRMMRICGTLSSVEGWEVCLVGREKKDSRLLDWRPYEQQRLSCFFEKGKLFYLEFNLRLFWFLLFAKVDVINAVDLDTLLPEWMVARIRGKKLVYDAHEYFTEVPEVVDRPLTKKIWESLADFLIPQVDRAYTVGEALAEVFSQRYGVTFGLVRNVPVKQDIQGVKDRINPPVILYQGALNAGRGLEVAIEAMQYLPDLQMWLAGEGDLSQQLRNQVAQLGLGERVTFLGYLLPSELKRITPQATVGLNLLENKGLSYYYSLANKAFDYIQNGVPAIHPNFPEYQRLNGAQPVSILLDSLTVTDFVEAIQKLTSDPKVYQELKSNCAIKKERYTWEEEALILITHYEGFAPSA